MREEAILRARPTFNGLWGTRPFALCLGRAATRPAPAHPCDLENWDWVRYRHRSDYTRLSGPGGEEAKVLGQARLEVDSVDALYHFACKNLGATVLPEHLAARGETEGKLSRLFPDWRLKPLGISPSR